MIGENIQEVLYPHYPFVNKGDAKVEINNLLTYELYDNVYEHIRSANFCVTVELAKMRRDVTYRVEMGKWIPK